MWIFILESVGFSSSSVQVKEAFCIVIAAFLTGISVASLSLPLSRSEQFRNLSIRSIETNSLIASMKNLGNWFIGILTTLKIATVPNTFSAVSTLFSGSRKTKHINVASVTRRGADE